MSDLVEEVTVVDRTCSIDGCERKRVTRGWCGTHYERWRTTGTTDLCREPKEQRFWRYVNKTDSCWLWTGATLKTGYGAVFWDGKNRRVYRIAWILAGNEIPNGTELDHICHVRLCVNPAHLRATTRKENVENHQGPLRNNKCGVRGVYQIPSGKWRAQVIHNGCKHHVGYFATIEEAESAVVAKRNELWTHNDLDRTA